MIVATDKSLITMIEHKDLFFKLIDIIDRQNSSDEIPLQIYNQLLRGLLEKQSDVEQRRLRAILNLENLHRADLVIEIDSNRGVFVLASFVVEMFRHFDRRRLRELSSAQLEDLRRRLQESLDQLSKSPLVLGDRVFDDQLELLRERIRTTHVKMRDNVSSLLGQAERLSEIIEQNELDNLEQSIQVSKALEQIDQIYQYHVLPTLQFLNERETFKEGQPALTSLRYIANLLDTAQLPELSQQMKYASASLRSYASDVEKIRRSLERYVRQNTKQRMQYNAIEAAFNDLLHSVRCLQDGSLKNNLLRYDDPVFSIGQLFSGLRVIRYSTRLEWHGKDQRLLFDEFLRVKLDQLSRNKSETGTVDLEAETEGFDWQQQIRKEKIRLLVSEWQTPNVCDDFHRMMHEYLLVRLSDYELSDLLEAMKWCVAEKKLQLKPAFCQRVIKHKRFELTYFVNVMEPIHAS
ncbi:hypothetical protein DN062_03575 [Nitrincola tibetensis]|uniref:Uncharacterized protein n=1 Tax=Nitrincola tibetensis TaxID=2219697 RepID=A0A364NQJ1_9GAMM|nr:hypothetical protein [Nitrincola tibetensis]RAU19351.1 hypothetical protein DN062_03575 [Nitrincola tibetensis]